MPDRREYARISLSLPVKVHLNKSMDHEVVYRSKLGDLSVGGFQIDLPESDYLRVGQDLHFEIDTIHSNNPVKVEGKLCWISKNGGGEWDGRAGVKLTGMEADDWDRWLHLMLAQNFTSQVAN